MIYHMTSRWLEPGRRFFHYNLKKGYIKTNNDARAFHTRTCSLVVETVINNVQDVGSNPGVNLFNNDPNKRVK